MDHDTQHSNITEYQVIRKLSISKRFHSYLVRAANDDLYIAKWLDKEALLLRYQIVFHDEDEDLPLDDVKSLANEKFLTIEENFKDAYSRVKDLYHPNIATHHNLIFDNERNAHILLTDYLSAPNLVQATQGLTPIQMIPLFLKAFQALQFQHQNNLLHLNIKSNTFFADLDTSDPIIKMMNYGFALPKDQYDGSFKGTAVYMAPEIALGLNDQIDERADLFSMGVLMYYCVRRSLPFECRRGSMKSIQSLIRRIEREIIPPNLSQGKDVPRNLEELIYGLLQKKPEDRMFTNAANIIMYMFEQWPEASQEMLCENTITSFDPLKR